MMKLEALKYIRSALKDDECPIAMFPSIRSKEDNVKSFLVRRGCAAVPTGAPIFRSAPEEISTTISEKDAD
ncbi:MAG TPA: hypothetical protein VMU05_18815 [Dongiaceae bacterium]|nr:hypothetical protein [Dongiaceae bacterium]